MRRKLDNRGSAMIIVIIIIAFVSILVSTLFMMSVMNIQMKSVDRESKENFYSAEGALEQIRLGLQKELSEVSTDAYALVMQQYANNTLEVERRTIFNDKLLGDLKYRLGNVENGGTSGIYDMGVLEGYLTTEVKNHTVLASAAGRQIVDDNGSIVLKGLEVTYTDDQGYQSVIETDIRLSAPNLNLVQPSDIPDVFDYSIIANEKLVAEYSGTVSIEAGVYAGEGGLNLDSGAVWNFRQAERVVVSGDVNVPRLATLTTTSDMDLWARELNVAGGTLTSKGRTYVSNDLVMSDEGSTVTLEGEYYGYGNGEALTDAGVTLSTGGDSSAILINGVDTTLDMSNMRRLLLSGSAQIATGDVTFDESLIEDFLPENEPSLDTKKETATLSSASYYMTSMGNGNIVRSNNDYLIAVTNPGETIVETSLERLILLNNEDGTVSLMDVNNEANPDKYITVKTDEQNRLVAESDTVGINEKFRLYMITSGGIKYYALQSFANGKFVSIDTYYPVDGGDSVSAVLLANRDKISDNGQLFLMTRWGTNTVDPREEIVDPDIIFEYVDANNLVMRFGHKKWIDNNGYTYVPNGYSAWLTCTVTRNGVEVEALAKNDVEMGNFLSAVDGTKWSNYINITDLQEGDVINYTIRYSHATAGMAYISGSYTHRAGQGNNNLEGILLADGEYAIRLDRTTGNDTYVQRDDNGAKMMGYSVTFDRTNGSWFIYSLVNNHDGTISLKSRARNLYFAVQSDGTGYKINDISSMIDVNSKFQIEYVSTDSGGYYQLWTLEESDAGRKCLGFNLEADYIPSYLVDSGIEGRTSLQFEWQRSTTQIGTRPEPEVVVPPVNYNPVTKVEYSDEDMAKVTFTSPYWTAGNVGTVKVLYSLDLSPTYPEINMTLSGTEATCTIPDLQHLTCVTYRFIYTYTDTDGVLKTVTTPNYVYIHERVYGEAVNVSGENVNINLGESIEVKSNQIAYLVPPECIGVNNGVSTVNKNPISAEEFAQMMVYYNDPAKYPDYQIVSFTKEVEGLGKSLGDYRTPGTEGYRTIFVQSAGGTMVYFYVDFDSDNTSAYFRDYYAEHQDTLETYMSNYVNEIRLSNRFTRLTTDGNMVYSAAGTTGRIDLRSNEGYGANPDATEQSSLLNEETGYQKRFKALSSKLMLDYDELTPTEKTRNLFDNIINYSTDVGDAGGHAFAGMATSATPISYTVDGATAHIVNNAGADAYRYNAAIEATNPDDTVCLIIATGDVVVEKDFAGVIIARGTVTVVNSSVNTIMGNQQAVYKVLKYQMDPTNPDSDTLLERYFRDGDRYVLNDGSEDVVTDGDYATYYDLITYEEWSKK